jgi:hypothetical protein
MPEFAQASGGTQDYVGDLRNDSVLISINGALTPRAENPVAQPIYEKLARHKLGPRKE